MLGKLIKYEWKSIWRVCVLMIAVLAGMTVLGSIAARAFTSTLTGNVTLSTSASAALVIFGLLVLFLYGIAMFAVSVGIYVYMGVHFNRKMFSSEGYLTHTLPVKKSSLLISKLFVDSIGVILVTISMLLSIAVLVLCSIPGKSMFELLSDLANNFSTFADTASRALGFDVVAYLIFLSVIGLIGPIFGLMILYGCICVGQLFGKAKVLMIFVTYFGICLVLAIVRALLNSVLKTNLLMELDEFKMGSYFYSQMFVTLGMQLVMGLIMYWISWLILNKKLNLQ